MIILTSIIETENSDGDDSAIDECIRELMTYSFLKREALPVAVR